jgi:hypothetical protein
VTRDAVEAASDDDVDKTDYLNSLIIYLIERYTRFSEMANLDEAIKAVLTTTPIIPESRLFHADILQKLGSRFGDLYAQTGTINWLDQTIKFTKEAGHKYGFTGLREGRFLKWSFASS